MSTFSRKRCPRFLTSEPKTTQPTKSGITRETNEPRAPRKESAAGAASREKAGMVPKKTILSAARSATSTVESTAWLAWKHAVATKAMPNARPPRG